LQDVGASRIAPLSGHRIPQTTRIGK
jgi:hypothetical protein